MIKYTYVLINDYIKTGTSRIYESSHFWTYPIIKLLGYSLESKNWITIGFFTIFVIENL